MKINGMVQAVILMLLLASAASCEVSQSYFKKVFPATTHNYSSTESAKFLKSDSISANDKIEMKGNLNSSDSISIKPPSDFQKSERIRTKRVRQTTSN
jgi:hypothetical protein